MRIIAFMLVALMLASCQHTNDVVHSGWIQKRKHRNGFHLNLKSRIQHQQEVASIGEASKLVELNNALSTSLQKTEKDIEPDLDTLSTQDSSSIPSPSKRLEKWINGRKTPTETWIPDTTRLDNEQADEGNHELRSSRRKIAWSLGAVVSTIILPAISFLYVQSAFPSSLLFYLGFGFLPFVVPVLLAFSLTLLIANIVRHRRLKKTGERLTESQTEKLSKWAVGSPLLMGASIAGIVLALAMFIILFEFAAPALYVASLALFILSFIAFNVFSIFGLFAQVSTIKKKRENIFPFVLNVLLLFGVILVFGFMRIVGRMSYEANAY